MRSLSSPTAACRDRALAEAIALQESLKSKLHLRDHVCALALYLRQGTSANGLTQVVATPVLTVHFLASCRPLSNSTARVSEPLVLDFLIALGYETQAACHGHLNVPPYARCPYRCLSWRRINRRRGAAYIT